MKYNIKGTKALYNGSGKFIGTVSKQGAFINGKPYFTKKFVMKQTHFKYSRDIGRYLTKAKRK